LSNEYGAQKVMLSLPKMETELILFLLEQANKLAFGYFGFIDVGHGADFFHAF